MIPFRISNPPRDFPELLSGKFDLAELELSVAGSTFCLIKVRDTNRLVDAIDPGTFTVDERLPYWADVWTSSVELARWCLEEAGLRGKRVLELGCGLGLAGIAAAKAGGRVTLSDYEQDALDFARYNAMRNLSKYQLANTEFVSLDWRNIPSLGRYETIIAADVVYERRNFFPLVDVLTRLLEPGGTAVFAEPSRSIGEVFFALLQEKGFHLATTHCPVHLNGKQSEVKRVVVTPPPVRYNR